MGQCFKDGDKAAHEEGKATARCHGLDISHSWYILHVNHSGCDQFQAHSP